MQAQVGFRLDLVGERVSVAAAITIAVALRLILSSRDVQAELGPAAVRPGRYAFTQRPSRLLWDERRGHGGDNARDEQESTSAV